jgi:DNA-binding PadR family transcriptional regulator
MPDQDHRFSAHSPEFALLGFLYVQSNHGYNLHRLLENELGLVWHVSQSQTYAILKRLELQGAVSSTRLEQEKLPSRQILQITTPGRSRFEDWLRTPSGSSVRAIRVEFITRLYFAQKLFPKSLPALFSAQLAEIDSALDRLEKNLTAVPPEQPFNRLGLELRIRQLRSIRDWLTDCRQTFEIVGVKEIS